MDQPGKAANPARGQLNKENAMGDGWKICEREKLENEKHRGNYQ